MRRLLSICGAFGCLLAASAGLGQIVIENLDRPDEDTTLDPSDSGLRADAGAQRADAGAQRADASKVEIVRGQGWGQRAKPAPKSPRELAFAGAERLIQRCLSTTEDPNEARIQFQYQVRRTRSGSGLRLRADLTRLDSNLEIHIDEHTLHAAEPALEAGKTLDLDDRARRFRDCLASFAIEVDELGETSQYFCMSGIARAGSGGPVIEDRTWSDERCPSLK